LPVTRKDKSDLKKNHEVEDINFVDTDTVGGSGIQMFCSWSRCWHFKENKRVRVILFLHSHSYCFHIRGDLLDGSSNLRQFYESDRLYHFVSRISIVAIEPRYMYANQIERLTAGLLPTFDHIIINIVFHRNRQGFDKCYFDQSFFFATEVQEKYNKNMYDNLHIEWFIETNAISISLTTSKSIILAIIFSYFSTLF